MKKTFIKKNIRDLIGITAIFLLLLAGCNNAAERDEPDLVNEIEAAENEIGDPVPVEAIDDPEAEGAGIEATEDSAAVLNNNRSSEQ